MNKTVWHWINWPEKAIASIRTWRIHHCDLKFLGSIVSFESTRRIFHGFARNNAAHFYVLLCKRTKCIFEFNRNSRFNRGVNQGNKNWTSSSKQQQISGSFWIWSCELVCRKPWIAYRCSSDPAARASQQSSGWSPTIAKLWDKHSLHCCCTNNKKHVKVSNCDRQNCFFLRGGENPRLLERNWCFYHIAEVIGRPTRVYFLRWTSVCHWVTSLRVDICISFCAEMILSELFVVVQTYPCWNY